MERELREQIRRHIRLMMNRDGITQADLARRTGFSTGTANEVANGGPDKPLGLDVLAKIKSAFPTFSLDDALTSIIDYRPEIPSGRGKQIAPNATQFQQMMNELTHLRAEVQQLRAIPAVSDGSVTEETRAEVKGAARAVAQARHKKASKSAKTGG